MTPIWLNRNLRGDLCALDTDQCIRGAGAENEFCRQPTLWRQVMNETKLRQDIIDEFEFDPSFDGGHVGVAVDRNVVTLSGHVNSYAQKVAAIAAARRVKG